MVVVHLTFECFRDTRLTDVERAINGVLDALRYNGQILGREFPTTCHDGWFISRVVCPEADSLQPQYHSEWVRLSLSRLSGAGLLQPKITLQGTDLNSDHCDPCNRPEWQLLYTSFLHSCSPLRCGKHFAPIPLYRIPPVANGDYKQVLKWQEDWEACDQLQMNGSIIEHPALFELSDPASRLSQRGWDLCRRIEYLTHIPTYYYLYRVGGNSLEQERQRRCPRCDQPWRLEEPLHDIFDFQCHDCRLLSNLSWDFKR